MANNEMQELNNINREDEFIQEKIKNKRKQKVLRTIFSLIFVLLCGLVFGFAVRMAMIFTDGRLKDLFGALEKTPTPMETQPPTGLPATGTPDPTGPVVSSVPVSLTPVPTLAEFSPAPTLAPIEGEIEVGVVDPSMPHPDFGYAGFYKEVSALTDAVRPQVAEINAAKTIVDWFGNSSYVNSQTSGLVIANNGQNLLLLADYNVVADSDYVNVRLLGKELEGTIYNYDAEYGLAIIAVDFSLFSEEERNNMKYAKLLPDDSIRTGSPVVAIGNANGYAGSIAFGMISGSGYKTYVTDGMLKYFTTDWVDYKNSGAFIYDMRGAVCGMITHTFKQNSDDGITTCISLDSVKDVITALINGRSLSTLGVVAGDLTGAISAKSGVNSGIYVRDVKSGSPAAGVGIRPGDIITAINEQGVKSASDLAMYLTRMVQNEYLTIDYRRVEENSINDQRVVVMPTIKVITPDQKGNQ